VCIIPYLANYQVDRCQAPRLLSSLICFANGRFGGTQSLQESLVCPGRPSARTQRGDGVSSSPTTTAVVNELTSSRHAQQLK
jgi:hypothetical protein